MPSEIRGYHIHVYFNKASASEKTALALREKAKEYWGEKVVGRSASAVFSDALALLK